MILVKYCNIKKQEYNAKEKEGREQLKTGDKNEKNRKTWITKHAKKKRLNALKTEISNLLLINKIIQH